MWKACSKRLFGLILHLCFNLLFLCRPDTWAIWLEISIIAEEGTSSLHVLKIKYWKENCSNYLRILYLSMCESAAKGRC